MRTSVKKHSVKRLGVTLLLCLWPVAAFASTTAGETVGVSMTHRMMLLVIQLGLILFVAKIGNMLFEKVKLPGTLGELVAGMVIGPYALGRIGFVGFSSGLFPAPVAGAVAISPELYGLAAVAAVVLLFDVGLQTDLGLLLRYSVAGGLVGLGGMFASFFLGAASAMVFSQTLFGRSLGLFAPQCLFLGIIATATSVGITVRILSERRKLDSPEGVTILSAAVIDDVMGIILLAIVMGIVTASRETGSIDWGHIAVVAAKAVGVWLAATVIGLVASRKISFLLKWFGERTAIAIMALGMALILAGLFEEAGLAMIIGAYVMGLSLSKADISRVIREKLQPVYALLIPVFFCTMGMQIDLGAMRSPPILIFGLVYAVVALLSKVVGCGLPALLANFNLRGAARIGFGMAPRCEVALVIAGVGLSAGLLPAEILAAVIIMVMVNAVLASPVMMMLFRSDASGTRKAVTGDKARTSVPFEFPSIEMTGFFVGKLVDVFESEGFFVHHISRRQRLYQLRKDGTVIDFSHSGNTLTFTCRQGDVHLVHTAAYEALAVLEQAIRGLKKPLDTKSIRAGLQDAGPLGPQTLNMKDYLSSGVIAADMGGRDKAEIIDELLEVLQRNGLVKNVQAAREAVWEREESMSTGLQYGVAIPHGKTAAVDRLVCAVGIKKDGVDFDAMDGEPSKIFILTLSPKNRHAPHIQFMSTVSQILNSEGRQRVLSCKNARQIYKVFTAPPPAAPAARGKRPPAAPAGVKFRLADYLKCELISPDLRGNTAEEIIGELIGLLDGSGLLLDADVAARTVLDRETQMSTGMGEGIAVPHGRTDEVDNLVCAVGIKREGIDFGAADGKPTKLFVLMLTPEGGSDPYLQCVASVMGVLDSPGRQRVMAGRTSQEILAALTCESAE